MILTLILALQSPLAVRADTLHLVHDALSYDISISIPDSGSRITGEAGIAWRLASAAPIRVQLDTAMVVTRVAWSGDRRLLRGEWRRQGDVLELPHGRQAGDTVTTRLTYSGTVREGLVIRNNIYGERAAFADNWPDRAHLWFPAQDHPADKATARFHVEVPRGWRAIATGALERVDTLPGGRTLWHYRMPHPVAVYSMVIGAGRMTVTRLTPPACRAPCVPVTTWTFRQDSAYAAAGPFRRAPQMIQY
nr:hypothetical protein [Gemmatimonadales bacterium]